MAYNDSPLCTQDASFNIPNDIGDIIQRVLNTKLKNNSANNCVCINPWTYILQPRNSSIH